MIDGTHLDPAARSVWVDLYQIGSKVIFSVYTAEGVEDREVEITPEFAASMMASFDALTAEGDRVTVLKEHRIDGEHYGTAHELRVDSDWLQARTSFVPSVWEAYDDERIVEFSPGFVPSMKNAHTGETHENVLLEVTITSMALQHTLRPPQETNASRTLLEQMARGSLTIASEDIMAEETNTAAEDTTQEEIEALRAELEAAKAEMAELQTALDANREEVDEAAAEVEEAEALAASQDSRIRALEDDIVRRDLRAAGVDESMHADMIDLARANSALYASMVKVASAPDAQKPIGTTGSAPVGGTLTASAILEEAGKAGKTYGKGLSPWLASNYPEQAFEVSAIARAEFIAQN